jgi:glycosyltransferase involved in cell wall biosynthesis
VLPSRHDGWGVVINEACAAGLPVVTTCQTGAARDLVEDGRSGFVVNADDPGALAGRLLRLIDRPDLRERFGRRSRELVAPLSTEAGARLFLQHVRRLVEGAGPGEERRLLTSHH